MTTTSKKTLGYVPFGTGQHKPFNKVYQQAMRVSPENVRNGDVDAVVIWGGEDISPKIYGQKAARWCGADDELSYRDTIEVAVCSEAIKQGVPIIGVCRGAQLACALAGGKLIQHVNHHSGDHLISTDDGRELITNSYHHQMMYPFDVNHDLIAWTKENRATMYLGEDENDDVGMKGKVEPEIVYFHDIHALAVQFHPEFADTEDPQVRYVNELIQQYLVL